MKLSSVIHYDNLVPLSPIFVSFMDLINMTIFTEVLENQLNSARLRRQFCGPLVERALQVVLNPITYTLATATQPVVDRAN